MTDLYVAWQKHPKAVVTVGKQSVPFTQEGATSSKELVTIDRSNLANNIWFTQEYMPGVSLSGRAAPWTYRAGIYSSGAMNRELGKFNGDAFTLALVGYDFAKKLRVREATLTGNYLYQHPDVNNTFTKRCGTRSRRCTSSSNNLDGVSDRTCRRPRATSDSETSSA